MKSKSLISCCLALGLMACKPEVPQADAYGNFEAVERIISAETQGRILHFEAEEGDALRKGELVFLIDTTQLALKRAQLASGRMSMHARIKTIYAQVKASKVQLQNLQREKRRIDRLVEGGAATSKQQDDLEGQIALLEAQIVASQSQVTTVHAELQTLEIQIRQVDDQLDRCRIKSPMDGVILSTYRRSGEMASPGLALFKMANLDELSLRAYVSGKQLSQIHVGKDITVRYDSGQGLEELPGKVSWVSSSAEFTPKIIQTREERVNLVYAVKVRVANQGQLKIGMPGELSFD